MTPLTGAPTRDLHDFLQMNPGQAAGAAGSCRSAMVGCRPRGPDAGAPFGPAGVHLCPAFAGQLRDGKEVARNRRAHPARVPGAQRGAEEARRALRTAHANIRRETFKCHNSLGRPAFRSPECGEETPSCSRASQATRNERGRKKRRSEVGADDPRCGVFRPGLAEVWWASRIRCGSAPCGIDRPGVEPVLRRPWLTPPTIDQPRTRYDTVEASSTCIAWHTSCFSALSPFRLMVWLRGAPALQPGAAA